MNKKREDGEIYSDLTDVDLGVEIAKLRDKEQALIQHVNKLQGDIDKLCSKIKELCNVRDNLSRNISELFKTAKVEISRKDRRIDELQSQLDDVLFRRDFKRNKRKRDEGNQETNELKRTKIEPVVIDVEEDYKRFERNRSFQWTQHQENNYHKYNKSNPPYHSKNIYHRYRNERRNSPNMKIEEKSVDEVATGQESYSRLNIKNRPYHWKNSHKKSRCENKIEEGSSVSISVEDEFSRPEKCSTSHQWREIDSQSRNNVNIEIEENRWKEDATGINCGEENSSRFNRKNSPYHCQNKLKQIKSESKIKEGSATVNLGSNISIDISNTAHHWKEVNNQSRNEGRYSANVEVEATRWKEEAVFRNVDVEEIHCESTFEDRIRPGREKIRFKGEKIAKEGTKERNYEGCKNNDEERPKKNDFELKTKQTENFKSDERRKMEALRQRYKHSESCRSSCNERQEKHERSNQRKENTHHQKSRSKSRDRHKTKNASTNKEKKEQELLIQDSKDLEVISKTIDNVENLCHKEAETNRTDIMKRDNCSENLEIKEEQKLHKTADAGKSQCNSLQLDHSDLVQNEGNTGNEVKCNEKIQQETKKLDSRMDKLEETKQKLNNSIENLNFDILRSDLNISNDSTSALVNVSDISSYNEVSNNSNLNGSVTNSLTTSLNTSNVSDNLMKKVTPTVKRRRCVISFKN